LKPQWGQTNTSAFSSQALEISISTSPPHLIQSTFVIHYVVLMLQRYIKNLR
jgi:hypothetical protein